MPPPQLDFNELRIAMVEAIKSVTNFILNEDLKRFSSLRDLQHARKSVDDQTKELDARALRIVIDSIKSHLPATNALLASEENPIGEPIKSTNGLPNLLFIIDPIDNTDGALHGGMPSSAISVYSRSNSTVIAAAVADPGLRQIYYADEETAAVSYPLSDKPGVLSGSTLSPSKQEEIEGAYISIYTLKPQRLLLAATATRLLEKLGHTGRVECLGGAISLCRVAAGYIDASVEFAKGFQAYDLFPGAYILRRAGGVCQKPDHMEAVKLGLEIRDQTEIPKSMRRRQIFIGAGTHQLYAWIQSLLLKDGIGHENEPLMPSPIE
jgi:myo-inositol-1(or 4)-monophosphatase